ncbi:hypothetical protein [Clostridium sp.]
MKILSFLGQVKDYPYLVIDVRGNGGGEMIMNKKYQSHTRL